MKITTERARQEVREYLYQIFASELNSEEESSQIMDKFDELTEVGKMSAESASKILYKSYGSTDGKAVLGKVSRWIHDNLQEFNTEFPKISLDSRKRLKKAIETLSNNIDKVSIVFNGQELTAKEVDAIKPKLPMFCRSMTLHQASASSEGAGLSIELIV